MKDHRILVVEDDNDINRLLCTILSKNGFAAESAFSGSEGKLRVSMMPYDLILLDLMLPGLSGEEFLTELRSSGNVTPVIVISARTALEDKVKALSLGADDYMTKPFESAEVLARIEAQLRRFKDFSAPIQKENQDSVKFRDLTLEPDSREAYVGDSPLNLTATEFELLLLLMSEPRKVFTREALYTKGWGGEYYGEDNTVNVHMSNIRNKLAKLSPGKEYIKTVWGIGFKMVDSDL